MEKVSYSTIIGAVLADLREEKGLTQLDLAHEVDISQSSIARIELGRAVTLPNVHAVCKFLGKEMWEVFHKVDLLAEAARKKGYDVVYELPKEKQLAASRQSELFRKRSLLLTEA